jgi:hypothetical protein
VELRDIFQNPYGNEREDRASRRPGKIVEESIEE